MWPFLFPMLSLKSRHWLWKATGTDMSFLGGEWWPNHNRYMLWLLTMPSLLSAFMYLWYDLCWKCAHKQVDFSLYEPSLTVEHVKTGVKLTYCDRHVTGMLKSKLPLLDATSNYSNRALYTDPACGIKCLFKVWLRKWRDLSPVRASIQAFSAIHSEKYPGASCCSSQLRGLLDLTNHFLLLIGTILCLLHDTGVSWSLLLHDAVDLGHIS